MNKYVLFIAGYWRKYFELWITSMHKYIATFSIAVAGKESSVSHSEMAHYTAKHCNGF